MLFSVNTGGGPCSVFSDKLKNDKCVPQKWVQWEAHTLSPPGCHNHFGMVIFIIFFMAYMSELEIIWVAEEIRQNKLA